jgi:hypothetical protein
MDQKFQQEFVRTIDNSVEGFYTHYQILLSFFVLAKQEWRFCRIRILFVAKAQ